MSETKPPDIRVTGSEWRRVALHEDEKDVSHLGYSPMPMRMGPAAQVRMAGLGGVGTDPAYRRRGLARKVFARSLEEMRSEGYASVGLYTGTQIVAHRLYRQFGFVDVLRAQAAAKVLNPAQFVCNTLAELLKGDLPEEVRTWRANVEVHLLEHRPIFLRISHQEVESRTRRPAHVDLTVSLHAATFTKLVWDYLTIDEAEDARLVEWQGEESHWLTLRALFRAQHEILFEGD
jgi:predicted acetyltransferase